MAKKFIGYQLPYSVDSLSQDDLLEYYNHIIDNLDSYYKRPQVSFIAKYEKTYPRPDKFVRLQHRTFHAFLSDFQKKLDEGCVLLPDVEMSRACFVTPDGGFCALMERPAESYAQDLELWEENMHAVYRTWLEEFLDDMRVAIKSLAEAEAEAERRALEEAAAIANRKRMLQRALKSVDTATK